MDGDFHLRIRLLVINERSAAVGRNPRDGQVPPIARMRTLVDMHGAAEALPEKCAEAHWDGGFVWNLGLKPEATRAPRLLKQAAACCAGSRGN